MWVNLYLQQDGVSMGSPLGVTFANFYMTDVENKFFELNPHLKPTVFCRYVSRENLVENRNILYYEPDFNRLQIMEAILIQELTPTINNQNTSVQRTLKLP